MIRKFALLLLFAAAVPLAAAEPDVARPKPAAKSPTAANPKSAPKPQQVTKPKPAAKPKKELPLTPGGKYRAHDKNRPRPPVVVPPTDSTPPSDAIVLFDGKNLDAWLLEGRDPKTKKPLTTPANWKIADGYAEIPPRKPGERNTIVTRDEFGACQLHLEWATPADAKGEGQGRGNSGVLLHGICEVQLLDSYENDTYPDGQAAAIYSNYPPLVNASRKPGEWQTLDIIFEPAKDAQPARITVLHNGLIVQHAEELTSKATKFKLALQDHTNPLRFQNIWIRELKERP